MNKQEAAAAAVKACLGHAAASADEARCLLERVDAGLVRVAATLDSLSPQFEAAIASGKRVRAAAAMEKRKATIRTALPGLRKELSAVLDVISASAHTRSKGETVTTPPPGRRFTKREAHAIRERVAPLLPVLTEKLESLSRLKKAGGSSARTDKARRDVSILLQALRCSIEGHADQKPLCLGCAADGNAGAK